MLLPRSHAWTPLQKWLIVLTALLGVGALGALVYSYERHFRGPSDTIFVGTWKVTSSLWVDDEAYYRFEANHTYGIFADPAFQHRLWEQGIWYGGGDFLYLRRSWKDLQEHGWPPLSILRMNQVSPTEFELTDAEFGDRMTLRRVDPAHLTRR